MTTRKVLKIVCQNNNNNGLQFTIAPLLCPPIDNQLTRIAEAATVVVTAAGATRNNQFQKLTFHRIYVMFAMQLRGTNRFLNIDIYKTILMS